mgnify:CR=1 FL=1
MQNLIQNVEYNVKDEQLVKYLKDEFTRIIRIESPQSSNPKFDFYKYAAKKDFRTALSGIFHDKGQKVVTNANILIAKKEDYPEEYDGKILGKDGKFIEAKFPNYEKVFPDLKKNAYTEHEVNFEAFADFVLQIKAEAKLRGGDTSFAFVQIGGYYFGLDLFQLLVSYMKEIGAKTIWTAIREIPDSRWDSEKSEYVPYTKYSLLPGYVEANGSRGLLMPILEPNDNPDNSILKM